MFSEILSLLGLGQRSASAVSSKRSEANKLNAEFEKTMNSNMMWLQTEQLHLRHKLSAIPGDVSEMADTVEKTFEMFFSELKLGLETATNSRKQIQNASRFGSLQQWDEVLSILYQQKSAAELQYERTKNTIGQFHRVIDNAVG